MKTLNELFTMKEFLHFIIIYVVAFLIIAPMMFDGALDFKAALRIKRNWLKVIRVVTIFSIVLFIIHFIF